SELYFMQRRETAHQESCADEKRERKCHFENDHGVAYIGVAGTATRSFTAVAKRIVQVAARSLQCRSQTENQCGEHGYYQREEQHGAVHADDALRWNDVRGDNGD